MLRDEVFMEFRFLNFGEAARIDSLVSSFVIVIYQLNVSTRKGIFENDVFVVNKSLTRYHLVLLV